MSNAPVAQVGAGTARIRMSRRLTVILVLALVVIVAGVVVTGGPADEQYQPLDPTSPAPDGLAGMVELFESLGIYVDITTDIPSDVSTRVFAPIDAQRHEEREQLRDFAARGGTLIVAGSDPLTPELDSAGALMSDMFGASVHPADCDLLSHIDEVEHGNWDLFDVPGGAEACFALADGAWLVAENVGAGTIITIGSAAPMTNGWLDQADNAAFAASLLAPGPSDVVVVRPPPQAGEGDMPLLDLVPPGVWRALILLTLAIAALVLWKGRRLGAPVAEQLPPVLPSAELARSVGQLYQRVGDQQSAAARLRADTRRMVAQTLGLAPETPPSELISLVVQRTAATHDDALLALGEHPVTDDHTLREVAAAVARVRKQHRVANAAPNPRQETEPT